MSLFGAVLGGAIGSALACILSYWHGFRRGVRHERRRWHRGGRRRLWPLYPDDGAA
jgi:membrane protein DedA with SNARE-associated domain